MLKAISFDWSGVISDDRMPVYWSNMQVLVENGINAVSFDEWLSLAKGTAPDFFWSQGVEGERDYLEERYRYFLGVAKDSGIVPTVYPDAEEVLVSFLGDNKHLSVVSSHPPEHLGREIIGYSLEMFFNNIYSGQVGKVNGIRKIVEEVGCSPRDVLYVGDTIFDIRAAKEVGVKSGGILTGYHSREMLEKENPDYIFNHLTHMRSVVLSE